jgi:exonuclease SbcC
MSAIECALTGAVTHLQNFEDDYPRCLRNTEYRERAEVWLEYLDSDKKPHHHHVAIESNSNVDRVVPVAPVLSHQDSLLFTDRCYLSQYRLGRLLEIYQASSKGTEQHLVRFARELLGLDVLENLINGLYVVKDERRLKNAMPSLDALHNQATTLTARVETLNADVQSRDQEWHAAFANIDKLDPRLPSDPWTSERLQGRITIAGGEQAKSQLSERRKRLQQQRGQMESAVGFLAAIPQSDHEPSDQLPKKLQEIMLRATEVRSRLSEKLVSITRHLTEMGWSDPNAADPADIDRLFRLVQSELRRLISVLDDEVTQRKSVALELKNGQNDFASAGAELQSLAAAVRDLATVSRKRVELLQAAIVSAEGNICPVCSRNYAEVGAGELGSHLKEELAKLGVTIAQIESQAAQRVALETKRDTASRRIATATQRLADGTSRYPNPEGLLQILRAANTNLEQAEVDRVSLIQMKEEEAATSGKIRAAQIRAKQYESGLSSVKTLAAQLSIGLPSDAQPSDVSRLVRERLDSQIAAVETEIAKNEALLTAYSIAQGADKALADAKRAVTVAQEQLLRVQAAEKATNDARTTARTLEKAAQTVKARLIQSVFNDKLNTLCQALYRRLVRLESFDPNLSEPRPVRGAIKAGVQAMSRKRPAFIPFQELASVVSASNLNTAALSLFLSLNLIQNPKHRVLLLDDPVQSMDDIHVVQLAALLRSLVRETNRQLLVAVHERAMFDYLALELGPTRAGDSLITLELSREPDGSNTTVKAEKRTWKPDSVSFGRSAEPNIAG